MKSPQITGFYHCFSNFHIYFWGGMHVKVREQLSRISPLPPPCDIQSSNPSCQVCVCTRASACRGIAPAPHRNRFQSSFQRGRKPIWETEKGLKWGPDLTTALRAPVGLIIMLGKIQNHGSDMYSCQCTHCRPRGLRGLRLPQCLEHREFHWCLR